MPSPLDQPDLGRWRASRPIGSQRADDPAPRSLPEPSFDSLSAFGFCPPTAWWLTRPSRFQERGEKAQVRDTRKAPKARKIERTPGNFSGTSETASANPANAPFSQLPRVRP